MNSATQTSGLSQCPCKWTLKEHEIDISGTKQDVDFKIAEDLAEDSPTQSLFL